MVEYGNCEDLVCYFKNSKCFFELRWRRNFFGIDDNGNVKGLRDVKQACLDIENKINDSITPQPDYTLELQNNDRTINLTVKSGLQKPYLYKSKAYKRNDTATIEVDVLELSRLILAVYEKALEVFKDYYQYEEIQGAHRKKAEKIPEAAFREAIANALIHRVWDVESQIKGAFSAESSILSSRRPDEPPVSVMSCAWSRSICVLDNRIIWQVPRKPALLLIKYIFQMSELLLTLLMLNVIITQNQIESEVLNYEKQQG